MFHISFSLVLSNIDDATKTAVHTACTNNIQAVYSDAQVHIHFTNTGQSPLSNKNSSQIKHIIAVASGKGGVGKSTVATNLALGLQKMGAKVGLMDADLYGPSIPTMLGLQGQVPQGQKVYGKTRMLPLEAHGLSVISIGCIVPPGQEIVVRGPRLAGTIKRFCNDVLWPSLDYLIVDLPPGTGDIQIALIQTVPIAGVVLVTTPQEVAVVDVERAMNMFLNPKINIPILGIVENMAWFTPKEFPDYKYYLFGEGGGKRLAEMSNSTLLGQIPIVQGIRKASDEGKPIVLREEPIGSKAFMDIAQKVVEQLAIIKKAAVIP
ncbi:MAG: Mrp/NBP35 family ATP-binding protein [Chitinophagales bacterium]